MSQSYWVEEKIEVEVDIEVEVKLRLRLKWGWDEVESKFILYVLVNSDMCVYLIVGSFLTNWGPDWLFWGWYRVRQLFWGLLMYVSFNSDLWFWLILGSFLTFWVPNGLYLGLGRGSKTVLGSTYVVEQLSCSLVHSILTSYLYLILGGIFSFLGP